MISCSAYMLSICSLACCKCGLLQPLCYVVHVHRGTDLAKARAIRADAIKRDAPSVVAAGQHATGSWTQRKVNHYHTSFVSICSGNGGTFNPEHVLEWSELGRAQGTPSSM